MNCVNTRETGIGLSYGLVDPDSLSLLIYPPRQQSAFLQEREHEMIFTLQSAKYIRLAINP